MPLTLEEARALVDEYLRPNPPSDQRPVAILDEETIEKDWGWVFFYQSRAFLETGDATHMLGGNAPIIVNKNDGSLHVTGTNMPAEYYIREYERGLT